LKRDGTDFVFRRNGRIHLNRRGASVQSTAGNRGVRISVCNAGYTTFRDSVRVLATHSVRQFPLHFPSHASPCAIRFQTHLGSRCPTPLCCLRFISERDPSDYFVEAEKKQEQICYVVVKRIIVVSHVVLSQSLI